MLLLCLPPRAIKTCILWRTMGLWHRNIRSWMYSRIWSDMHNKLEDGQTLVTYIFGGGGSPCSESNPPSTQTSSLCCSQCLNKPLSSRSPSRPSPSHRHSCPRSLYSRLCSTKGMKPSTPCAAEEMEECDWLGNWKDRMWWASEMEMESSYLICWCNGWYIQVHWL